MQVSGKKRLRYLFGAAAALLPLYVILTVARSHDVAYLNGIFEMKDQMCIRDRSGIWCSTAWIQDF